MDADIQGARPSVLSHWITATSVTRGTQVPANIFHRRHCKAQHTAAAAAA